MITPGELKALLKKHRWSMGVSKSGKQQVYAAKQRRGKRLATCYIGTSNRLNFLTEEDVVAKINRSVVERLAQMHDGSGQALSPTVLAGKSKYNLPQFQAQQAGG